MILRAWLIVGPGIASAVFPPNLQVWPPGGDVPDPTFFGLGSWCLWQPSPDARPITLYLAEIRTGDDAP